MTTPVHVLIVEDSPDDAELMALELRREAFTPTWQRVESAPDMRAALQAGLQGTPWDLILSDYNLPEFGALAALELARELAPDIPFVVVSGAVGEEVAVEVMRAGACDYVLKQNLTRLGPAIRRELREADSRKERRRAEQAAYRLAAIVQSSEDAIIGTTLDGIVTDWNPGAERLLGYQASEIVGKPFSLLVPADRQEEDLIHLADPGRTRRGKPIETVRVHKDGTCIDVAVTISPIHDSQRRQVGFSRIARDIRLRLQSEQALRRDALLLANVRDAVIVTDLDGIITYWNEGATRLYGWSAQEMLGKHYADRYDEPIRSQVIQGIQSLSSGREWSGEFEDHHKDGSRVWIEARASLLLDASGRPVGILGLSHDISRRKEAERQLAETSKAKEETLALLETLLTHAPVGFAFIDPHLRYVRCNEALAAMNGLPPTSHLGRTISEVVPELWTRLEPLYQRMLKTGQPQPENEITGQTAAAPGKMQYFLVSLYPVQVGGQLLGIGVVVVDITERRTLEQQFRQAQKMEAIGRLAGGVAHDFNNLLTIINGYGDIVLGSLPADSPVRELIREIMSAGDRAAGLTRQLLAFSRKSVLEPKVLDINTQVRDMAKLLHRLIGEDIALTTSLAADLGTVKADPGQLEQALINLCVNARDAMPSGGSITIETRNVRPEEIPAPLPPEMTPGPLVQISVSDTGHGMDAATRAHIFEPFFTTKEQGKGTGLGLAMVYGFVKQSGGHIDVASEPGKGTTFLLYLPALPGAPLSRKSDPGLRKMHRGTETLLLVEDEPGVRVLARHILQTCGYTVLEAVEGHEALRTAKNHTAPLHLLVTDVVMPNMGGRQVAEGVKSLHPEVKILYLSGYTDDAIMRHGIQQASVDFLQKPFTPTTLAQKVREVLDR